MTSAAQYECIENYQTAAQLKDKSEQEISRPQHLSSEQERK